jgi:hypothetical protein
MYIIYLPVSDKASPKRPGGRWQDAPQAGAKGWVPSHMSGSSRLIIVDPPELIRAGEDFRRMAEVARRLAKQVLEVTGSAPSYDGEFGPRVRGWGVDLYNHIDGLARLAQEAGDRLVTKGQDFAEADRESLAGLAAIGEQLRYLRAKLAELEGLWVPALLEQFGPPPFGTLSLTDLEAMTMDERIAWMRSFNQLYALGWFTNFIDILHYFKDSKIFLGGDGSTPASEWISWADAATLQVVQDGYLLARDPNARLPGLPEGTPEEIVRAREDAARMWGEFFRHLRIHPEDDGGLRALWGPAEQAGIDYATALADHRLAQQGLELSDQEREAIDVFVRYGNIYRWGIPIEHAQALMGDIPDEIGAAAGEALGQTLEDAAKEQLQGLAAAAELIAEDAGRDLVDQAGEGLFGWISEAGEGAGRAAGDQVSQLLDKPLDRIGEEIFDPRLHLGVEFEAGPVRAEAELRGPVYHMAMAIEAMLRRGDREAAHKALEALERIRDRVDTSRAD